MNQVHDLSSAAHVECLAEDGQVLCRVDAGADVESLRLNLSAEDARRAWTLRLIRGDGTVLAELPTRSAHEVRGLAAGLIDRFQGAQP